MQETIFSLGIRGIGLRRVRVEDLARAVTVVEECDAVKAHKYVL